MAASVDAQDLKTLLETKDTLIRNLESLLQARDDEIQELRSHLNMLQSVFPFSNLVSATSTLHHPHHVVSPPVHQQSQNLVAKSFTSRRKRGRVARPRKQRAQGISAEPQSLSTIQELSQKKFPTYPKNDRSNCKETVTSPGFSFRIAQKAREMRPTTPNIDVSNLSTSYTQENSLNGNNIINGNSTSRDIYDKKRKLMESLDNFGVRKRTRQEIGVDAFVNRRRRTISESNAPDRIIVMNGQNHRFNQPIPTVTNSSSVNVKNKKTKRQGDFGSNMCQPQKKPRTLNNEKLSSYSSSKFLLTSGQKRHYPSVISMEQNTDLSNVKNSNKSSDSIAACVQLPMNSKCNKIQPAVTEQLNSTSVVQSTMPLIFGLKPSSESTPKISEEIKINTPQFNFGSPIASAVTSVEENHIQTNEVDVKVIDNQTPKSTNNGLAVDTQNSTVKNPNEQNESLEKNKNTSDHFQIRGQNNLNNDKDKPSFQFTAPASKQSESVMNSSTISDCTKINDNSKKQAATTYVFGIPIYNSLKQEQPSFTFGAPNANEKQSTPIMQFGVLKPDDKQSTPVMQFSAPKVDNKQSTPVMKFGAPKVDTQSTPIVQFGIPKVVDKHSNPVLQFGATKSDALQSTPKLQFEATKGSENQIISTPPLFSFGNNQKSIDNSKPTDSVKFQFDSSKSDSSMSLTESTNVVFGSNSPKKNLFNFGKTDNIILPTGDPPKYDATIEKSTPKLEFGTLPTSVFGASTADQSNPELITSVSQSTTNPGPKLVFGSLTAENKPKASGMVFANNTANPIFQFNNSGSKLGDKPSETPSGSFPFTSNKTIPAFGASADKPAFQFNTKKTEETKTQFSTSGFGSQNTSAPFKFGGNEKPASFGTTFPSSNQPLQFSNNTEKTAEPFKFGSTVQTSNAFQFSANKTDNGPVKFGQASNTFATSGFSGFGNSAPQQNTSFGTVQSLQPSPFGNITLPTAAPSFSSAVLPPSNIFGANQSFQFGSTNNVPSSSSTFAFGSNSQPFIILIPTQWSQAPSALSTPQFGGAQPSQGSFGFGSPPMTATVMPGSSQPLFSMGTAPAGESRTAKAVRRRQ